MIAALFLSFSSPRKVDGKKRKKSGYDFRKDKKLKEMQESAKACSKITSFYEKPPANTSHEKEINLHSNEEIERILKSENKCQNENPNCVNSILNSHTQSEEFIKSDSTLTSELEKEINLHSNEEIETILYSENKCHNENPNCVNSILNSHTQSEEFIKSDPTLTSEPNSVLLSAQSTNSVEHEIESKMKDYFKKPTENDLSDYFSFHPCQPDEKNLPFSEKKTIFHVTQEDGQTFKRQWLSYNEISKRLYCYICLVYTNGSSTFCSGFQDWRHIHQRIEQHETSKAHMESVQHFMEQKQRKSTYDLLFNNQAQKRKQEVLERRHIINVIVDVLKVIGKQGLAFRGSSEQAYNLYNESLNHSNFLEIILLLSKYDATLKKHLDASVEKSKNLHQARELKENTGKKNKAQGRGSFVTFLSNNTVMKIITIIQKEMKKRIAGSIKEAGKYSILMDTTIDISGNDQCAFVVRYVRNHEVFERLLSLKCVTSTTADGLLTSLTNILEEVDISIEDCVANAFDGASNMSGPYNGLTAKLSDLVPNHIHTWCYAHVLNLVLTDTAQVLPATISFFSLLQEAQVFMKESLKRHQKYVNEGPAYKLEAIGATRWRSRSDACIKIFGRIDNWTSPSYEENSEAAKYVFFELTTALFKISSSKDFNSKVRNDASAFLQNFVKFETIVTAMVFLQIFKITTPLSDYLQTKNLDYAQAWRLIKSATNSLKDLRDGFDETLGAAQNFISNFNKKVELSPCNNSLIDMIENDFKKKRPRKIKKMAGEECRDEKIQSSPQEEFKVHIFYCIIDTIVNTMENRFQMHKNLYLDLSLFDPKRFRDIKSNKLPKDSLEKISKLLPTLDKGKLKEEMVSFSNVWPSVSNKTLEDDYKTVFEEGDEYDPFDENEEEDDTFKECNDKTQCNACIKCAFKIITEYNMYSLQYTELYKVYKYLLTIPLTQVSCERVFSKLKLIKTRLRACMADETLEAFVLMGTEKDILNSIEHEFVISKLCESSSEMRRLLTF